MGKRHQTLVDWLTYILFRLAESILLIAPMKLCFWVGSISGTLLYFLLKRYRELAIRNIRIAFGEELSPCEERRLARLHFATLASNFLCSLKFGTLPSKKLANFIEYDGVQHLIHNEKEKIPIIYVTPHMGAWELLAQIDSIVPTMKRGALYRALSNKLIDKHVLQRRETRGLKAFDRNDGFHIPIKHLKEGGTLGIMVDQSAAHKGVWCPLFGKLASTSNLAPLLAKKTGATMFPYFLSTVKPAKWKVSILEPFLINEGEKISETTARMNQLVEKMVRHSPKDWFWLHNRWKTLKPKFLIGNHKRGYHIPSDFNLDNLKKFKILILTPKTKKICEASVPAIEIIAKGRPDAEVTVLCDHGHADIWTDNKNQFGIIEKSDWTSTLRKVITESEFDVAIMFNLSNEDAINLQSCGLPHIVGCKSKETIQNLDHIIENSYSEDELNYYLHIAECVGAKINSDDI
ncbi:MAG: hypothetical protein CBC36_04070 [Verrucomicrobiaceae bacterium TMED76]|nr:MAG: hypothetical protein CBC36_04070 [Verrucomicrobiaceae bacterium TMED76]